MSSYEYSSLSPEGSNIRLLCLLPNEDETAPIQCELRDYSLLKSSPRTHLYEALSYVWGNATETLPIYVNKDKVFITVNLHAALLCLRDHTFERIIWIDAICINQKNKEERGQQVQLMAKIYSSAHRVIVWLGGEAEDTDKALEGICFAAKGNSINNSRKEKIINLLQRPWFQRIWVLQEVAAARHVVMKCGLMEIDGHTFCLGIKSLQLPYTTFPKLHSLPSLIFLIEQAGVRFKYPTNSPERFSLEIGRLVELVDMFHTREASDIRDKVYALLGMSSDDPSKAGLQPDYNISWGKLFQKLVKFILYEDVHVETSDNNQMAVIESKGCILGRVSSVQGNDGRNVSITFMSKNPAWCMGEEMKWTLQASAKSIRENDIVCLLQGASKPTIIRQCMDYFTVTLIAAAPLKRSASFGLLDPLRSITHFPRDFLLTWVWENPLRELQDQEQYEVVIETAHILKCSNAELGDHSDKATRIWNIALVLGDLGEHAKAEERLREAIEMVIGEGNLKTSKSQYGITPLSWAARNGYDEVVKALLAKVDIDANLKDSQYNRTPLSWAAIGGHEAVAKLLLDTGKVDIDSKDKDGWTPLSLAARSGHEALIKLLVKIEKVDINSKSKSGWTPLLSAARGGHEAIVELLLETGKVDMDSKNKDGRTSLLCAAIGGHDGVARLLLKTGKVDIESKDRDGLTSLAWAARGGHKDVAKLLLNTGMVNIESTDKDGWTPFLWAVYGGHETTVKLLLETSAVDIDLKDKGGWTPLLLAARSGYEAIVKLLIETGKVDIESKDKDGWTPFSWAAYKGHEAVVKLLLETGKVDIESKDEDGWTPYLWAIYRGRAAVANLLLKTGKINVE